MGFHSLVWVDKYPTGYKFPAWGPPDGEVEIILNKKAPVRAALTNHARRIHSRAEGLLAVRHNHDNSIHRVSIKWRKPSHREWSPRKTDHRIYLEVDVSINPFDGESKVKHRQRAEQFGIIAAKGVEYGHNGRAGTGAPFGGAPFNTRGKRYPGKWILHDAAGLPRPD